MIIITRDNDLIASDTVGGSDVVDDATWLVDGLPLNLRILY